MDERQWLTADDPAPMLGFLDGKVSNRKFWLFACGGCRRLRPLLADPRCRDAVEVGERYADGQASHEELQEASEEAFCRRADLTSGSLEEAAAMAAAFAIVDPAHREFSVPTLLMAVQATCDDLSRVVELSVAADEPEVVDGSGQAIARERAAQAALVHCVFGNPFRPPPPIDLRWLAWNDGIVKRLAAAIYDERAFERMPILADALEEVGCADEEVLRHLRGPGPHVRGCWVIDLILGKE